MAEKLDVQRLRSQLDAQGLTQKEFAIRSGLSRAQVSRLLSRGQATADVRESTLQRIAKGLGLHADEIAVGGALAQFRTWTSERFGRLDFRGIGMPQYPAQDLDAVFVEPEVTLEESLPGEPCEFGERSDSHGRRHASVPIAVTSAIHSQDRVILLGHPGSGKTTVLHKLAHVHSSDPVDRAELELPLYVRLPEFSRAKEMDERTDIFKFIVAMASVNGCLGLDGPLRAELSHDRRRVLVLFDGLDEVGDEKHVSQLVDSIQDFIAQFPRNRFVITSRIVGFDPLPWTKLGFAGVRLLGYGPIQQGEFAKKWAKISASVHHRPEATVLDRMRSAIFSNPRARTLAENPLILTILVLLNEARGGALPRRRVDLYSKIVDVFIDTWESSKRPSNTFDETFNIDLDSREFRWLLSDLSLAMQKASRTLAPRWWLIDRMRDCLQEKLGFGSEEAKEASDRIIDYLVERTGLIQECGLDVFGFSHRTLQEYFASLGAIDEAEASTSRSMIDSLRGYLYQPQWCEVVRLIAAQQTPPVAEALITCILDDPDPIGRFLRRGPFLALRCLSDGATVPDRRLVTSVFHALWELGRSKWLGVTLEAFEVLDGFDGTRLEQLAKDTIEAILKTAKEELSRSEYAYLNGSRHVSSLIARIESQLPSTLALEAVREEVVNVDGGPFYIVFFNDVMRIKEPALWYNKICAILQDNLKDDRLKEFLIRYMGRRVITDSRARKSLRKILGSSASSALRVAAVQALGHGAGRRDDGRLLIRVLEHDSDVRVRAACAAALKDIAAREDDVCDRLMQILQGTGSIELRAGAARGLRKAAVGNPQISGTLLRLASMQRVSKELRAACAWALVDQIGSNAEVADAIKSWLDAKGVSLLQHIAAQALAQAMSEEVIPWDHQLIERIELILLGLAAPCAHALASLEALANARESRRGLRLETVLRDALKPLIDRIEIAFVFGSTARNRQIEDSDIDLMVIGEVKLKDLSTLLRGAERTLGRRISPVIYTRATFEQRYQNGDPFLMDVYRREKIPLFVSGDCPSQGDLDNELRAMVAERLAST